MSAAIEPTSLRGEVARRIMRIYPDRSWGAPEGCHTAIFQISMFGGSFVYAKKHFTPQYGPPHTTGLIPIDPQTPEWDRLHDDIPQADFYYDRPSFTFPGTTASGSWGPPTAYPPDERDKAALMSAFYRILEHNDDRRHILIHGDDTVGFFAGERAISTNPDQPTEFNASLGTWGLLSRATQFISCLLKHQGPAARGSSSCEFLIQHILYDGIIYLINPTDPPSPGLALGAPEPEDNWSEPEKEAIRRWQRFVSGTRAVLSAQPDGFLWRVIRIGNAAENRRERRQLEVPRLALAMHNFMQYSWRYSLDISQFSDASRFLEAYDNTLSIDIGEAAINQVDSYWSFADEDIMDYP
ncbi:hypothetical protein B0J15DRAFT_471038 [Fusarium solani]|uniref:Uncharacterized protein n=1 Tax=Fusarium solani TaxID=169388 RepID=A0A9P9JYN0_FUSSL|nr:uncharacterized protein B0J15DRAFT_471038 [Fusarium solani]KAH7238031.1 hypothetical protein B0J15DRAFT_471038 [Fusarium solani]